MTLTGRGCRLDRVQHAMTSDRIFKARAKVRSLPIVAGETRIRLRDVRAQTRLRRRPPILRRHGQDLERGLRRGAAAYGHLEELGLAPDGGQLQVTVSAVDPTEHVGPARGPAARMSRECGAALEESA